MLTVWLMASMHLCWGQAEPSVRAATDLDVVSLGDRLTLTLAVEHAPGQIVAWPTLPDTIGPFEVMGVVELPPIVTGGRQTSALRYSLTTFELGEAVIPAIEVSVADSNDVDAVLLGTEPIRILVESVGIDESGDIRNVKDPLEIPRNWLLLLPWVFLIVAVGSLGYWLYRRYRARQQTERPLLARFVPSLPPHEIAYAALNRLEAKKLPEKGQIKQYFIELSEIIRTYLEGRYPIDALEMTSHEVLLELKRIGLEPEVYDLFPPFFTRSDLVKFAKLCPDVDTCNQMIPMARLLVDETRAQDRPEAAEEGAGEVKTPGSGSAQTSKVAG